MFFAGQVGDTTEMRSDEASSSPRGMVMLYEPLSCQRMLGPGRNRFARHDNEG